MTTYEIIKKLPAKGFNWKGFVAELRGRYVVECENRNRVAAYLPEIDPMIAQGGVRNMREVAMWLANILVQFKAQKSHWQAPSEQTLVEGGFLGGEMLVWTDSDDEENATQEIADLAAVFA